MAPSVRNGSSAVGIAVEEPPVILWQLLHISPKTSLKWLGFAQQSAVSAYQWVMGEPRPCDSTEPLAVLHRLGQVFFSNVSAIFGICLFLKKKLGL